LIAVSIDLEEDPVAGIKYSGKKEAGPTQGFGPIWKEKE
jgi:hypothetical protein